MFKNLVFILGVLVLVSQDTKFGNHYLWIPWAEHLCGTTNAVVASDKKVSRCVILQKYIAAWVIGDSEDLPDDVLNSNTTVIK
jgi:hypothetical protein